MLFTPIVLGASALLFHVYLVIQIAISIPIDRGFFSNLSDVRDTMAEKQKLIVSNLSMTSDLFRYTPRSDTGFFTPLDLGSGNFGLDFFQFYESGFLFRLNRSIYPTSYHRLLPDLPNRAINRYPPVMSFFIGVPFSLFQPWPAYLLWRLLNEVLLIGCLYILGKWLDFKNRFWWTTIPWLLSAPIFQDLRLGQVNLFIAFGTLLMFHYSQSARFRTAISVWGAITSVKLIPIFFAGYLLQRKTVSAICICILIITALNAGYFLIFPDDISVFFHWVFASETFKEGSQTFIHRITGTVLIPRIFTISVIFIAISLSAGQQKRGAALLSLWIAVYFLIYTRIWVHHYSLYLVGAGLMLKRIRNLHLFMPVCLISLPRSILGFSEFSTEMNFVFHFLPSLWLFITASIEILKLSPPESSHATCISQTPS